MTLPTQIRRPPIRVRPVPPLDPPFTDELADFSVSPGVQLAFDLSGRPPQQPAQQSARQPRRQQDSPAAGPHELPPDALAGASPDARRAARRFLAASVEIINGFRPVSHARRLAGAKQASAVCVQLAAAVERARAVNRPSGADQRRGPQPSRPPGPAPSRPGPTPRDQRRAELLRVRQLRVCEPVPGVVESAVVLGTSNRSCALMFRLERQGESGAWLGTDVQLI